MDEDDQVYRTAAEKYAGIIEQIKEAHAKGQPILVGTTSIEKSEAIAEMLRAEGLTFNVLNARQHEQEAQIVADAGKLGAITMRRTWPVVVQTSSWAATSRLHVMEAMAADPDADPEALRAKIEAEVADEKEKVKQAGGLLCWHPSVTKAAGSTTSCAAVPAVRVTLAARRSFCRSKMI